MAKYVVYSGKLTVVVLAETAYDAAVEALQWWGDRALEENAGRDGAQALEPELTVQRVGSTRRGARFATFEMLACARGEEVQVAWRKRLEALVPLMN